MIINNSSLLGIAANRKAFFGSLAANFNYLPNPDIVLSKLGKPIDFLREMLSDPHVYCCVQSRKSGVLTYKWSINQGSDKTDISQFIENIFNNFDVYRIFNNILDAVFFGYSAIEIMWQYQGGKLVPIDLIERPAEWFIMDYNNLPKFRKVGSFEGEFIPQRKFLIIQHNPSYSNPYGESLLSKCYWSYFFKKEVLKYWSEYAEKYGMPYMVYKSQDNVANTDTDKILDSLNTLRGAGIILQQVDDINPNTSISLLTGANSSSSQLFQNYIEFSNTEISKAILSQTLTVENTKPAGSYAMAKTHEGIRADIIDADKRLIENSMNLLIKWIVELNFGIIEEQVKFSLDEEADIGMDKATRDVTLKNIGVQFRKQYVTKNYPDIDEDDFDIVPIAESNTAPAFTESENNTNDFKEHTHNEDLQKIKDNGIIDFRNATKKDLIDPVMKIINESSNYNEVPDKLKELYPKLKTKEIENIMTNAILLSNVSGKNNA